MATTLQQPITLRPEQFQRIRDLLYRTCRIHLQPGREALVQARLNGRLRELGLSDFDAYLRRLEADSSRAELGFMVDALTTNKTSFFREPAHFDYLREHILPALARDERPLRFWSAGCSSGEEPYSLAIALCEHLPDFDRRDVRILATDISRQILEKARRATYEEERLEGMDERLRARYFRRLEEGQVRRYQVVESLRRRICFARLNLMNPWPMRGPFEVIFCRNVMIYFDRPTRAELVRRFYELLPEGGHLFIGHSETLNGYDTGFRYVRPATYVK